MLDLDAERLQGRDHHLRVLAVECSAQDARPFGQRRDHEARFVRLFEPGTRATARGGAPVQGSIRISDG